MFSVETQSGEVRSALGKILATPAFAGSAGLSALLRYLVEQTLEGCGGRLKEYTLGVEVFDRGESFDPRDDTIVRVQARRLRAKLKEYYRGEGRVDPVAIAIPKGAYIAEFGESGARIESLAVLPLKNLSGDPDEERLADGLTGALIADLVRMHDLRVTGEISAMKLKSSTESRREIARKLDVDAIIEGSVYRTNGSIRLTASLFEPFDGRQLWNGYGFGQRGRVAHTASRTGAFDRTAGAVRVRTVDSGACFGTLFSGPEGSRTVPSWAAITLHPHTQVA